MISKLLALSSSKGFSEGNVSASLTFFTIQSNLMKSSSTNIINVLRMRFIATLCAPLQTHTHTYVFSYFSIYEKRHVKLPDSCPSLSLSVCLCLSFLCGLSALGSNVSMFFHMQLLRLTDSFWVSVTFFTQSDVYFTDRTANSSIFSCRSILMNKMTLWRVF